jgi:hypothetical protein
MKVTLNVSQYIRSPITVQNGYIPKARHKGYSFCLELNIIYRAVLSTLLLQKSIKLKWKYIRTRTYLYNSIEYRSLSF